MISLSHRNGRFGRGAMNPRPIERKLAELREQREREQRDPALTVVAEFGGRKKERMLVPEDDPANNELVLRLPARCCFCVTRSDASAMSWNWCRPASRSG